MVSTWLVSFISKTEPIISRTESVEQKGPYSKPKGKVVYLTIDDGPTQYLGQFLDILEEHNVKATFFMQGSNLINTSLQDEVKRVVKEGHYIGAHSMTHNYAKLYKNGQFVPEMKETIDLIHTLTGTRPVLVRPPYGSAPALENKHIRDEIAAANMKVWDWTVDSNDWELKNNPRKILENIKE